ncbi:MAG: hypothetical protein II684_02465 [Treponema sp.]|nr:hypothetical protein [Treponema sp.]
MATLEDEKIGFDDTFEIECVIYDMLERTISKAIDDELNKDGAPTLIIAKEKMLKNILSRNIDGLEEQQYMTVGPEGKTYLCGSWLMRPVLAEDGSFISTMDYIKSKIDYSNIVFLPNKTGVDLRKELWFAKNHNYTSYNLPKECRLESSAGGESPMGMPPMGAGGPPPGMGMPPMGAGGPPPGMGMPPMGAGGPPPGMGMPPMGAGGPPPALLSTDELIAALKKAIGEAIKNTVLHSVDESVQKDNLPPPEDKENMIKGIVARNIAVMEESKYIFTEGGTVYVCGDWLLRQVSMEPAKIPLIGLLKQQFHQYTNIEYRPDIQGSALLAQLKK